ncbi:AraC family transcriptional regulator [Mesonia sp. K7]|uniref:helix-turn-helix domain-containing protein n=1 Tax=Mesonia sp. K7 TaxID=2218606 RepID=UPI000DA81933|nr:AraC family transcriptional regulator [Mesonia sp. K7]PZD76715.1 AraC family transcriptional regulator [Mesonia sp. K7]
MNQIKVVSLPLKDVIYDFAKAFHTTYSENCNEYKVEIPAEWGTGYIKGMNFKEGLGILQYDCTFKNDLAVHFTVRQVHPLKFLYGIKGSFDHIFEKGEEVHEIEKYQGCIVASENHLGHVLRFKGGVHTILSSLEIVRHDFRKQLACEFQHTDATLHNIFKDRKAENAFFYKGFFSLQLYTIFQEIRDFQQNDLIKKIFLEGKAYNILAQQILEYYEDVNSEGNEPIIRQKEVENISRIANYIKTNLSTSQTVKALASQFGIPENKLQAGFKTLYGKTVNEYLQQQRLEVALLLLKETELNISEIVYKLGISSRSYFSKIFKKEYGIAPSEFKKKGFSP